MKEGGFSKGQLNACYRPMMAAQTVDPAGQCNTLWIDRLYVVQIRIDIDQIRHRRRHSCWPCSGHDDKQQVNGQSFNPIVKQFDVQASAFNLFRLSNNRGSPVSIPSSLLQGHYLVASISLHFLTCRDRLVFLQAPIRPNITWMVLSWCVRVCVWNITRVS